MEGYVEMSFRLLFRRVYLEARNMGVYTSNNETRLAAGCRQISRRTNQSANVHKTPSPWHEKKPSEATALATDAGQSAG